MTTQKLIGHVENQSDWDTDALTAVLETVAQALIKYEEALANRRRAGDRARGPKFTMKRDRLARVFVTQHNQAPDHRTVSVSFTSRSNGAGGYKDWVEIALPSPTAAGLSPVVLVSGGGLLPSKYVRDMAVSFGAHVRSNSEGVIPKRLPAVPVADDPTARAMRAEARVREAVDASVDGMARRSTQMRTHDSDYLLRSDGILAALAGQATPGQVARIRTGLAEVVAASERRHQAFAAAVAALLVQLPSGDEPATIG